MSPSLIVAALFLCVLAVLIAFFFGIRRTPTPAPVTSTVAPAPQGRSGIGCLIVLLLIVFIVGVIVWPTVSAFLSSTTSSLSESTRKAFAAVQLNSASSPTSPPDSVVGDPDISASFIDRVLKGAGSPAAGIGEEMVQDSAKSGIKTSFILAVFHHESRYGLLGVATTHKSMGNIRNGAGGYRSYASWQSGVRDFCQLIKTVYIDHGLTTIDKIIPVYAPSSDGNDVNGYIQAVRSDMAEWQKQGG